MKLFWLACLLGGLALVGCGDDPVPCGADTHDGNGTCLSDVAPPPCQPGTHADAGQCAADVVCGAGTHAADGRCLPDVVAAPCDAGTHEAAGRCVPDLTCGAGTHPAGGKCVSDPVSAPCGTGTHEVDGTCQPDVVCGKGTHADAGRCMPDEVCGKGTHAIEGVCAPDLGFQLRVVEPEIEADGHTKIPVFAIGTNPDGSASRAAVVFNITRAGAGTYTTPSMALGQLGSTTYFAPCNALTPGCTGDLTLTLALATAPTVPVATVDVTLVPPTGVGSVAACLVGGNAMFLDGNDYIFSGRMTVTQATWSAGGSDSSAAITVNPLDASQGSYWDLDFSTRGLGIALAPGVYRDAQREPFAQPGHPGLEVTGNHRGCNTITGAFQVHEFERDSSGVKRALVSFEQHCEGGAAVLNGCINYQR